MRYITSFEDIYTVESLLRRTFPVDINGWEYRGKIYKSVLGGVVEFGHVKDQRWLIFAEDNLDAVVFVSIRNRGTAAYICFLASNPDKKGQGLGRTLLTEVMTHLNDKYRVQHISLTCYDELVSYYQRFGFRWLYKKSKLNYLEYRVFLKIHVSQENNPQHIVQWALSQALLQPGKKIMSCERWEESDFIWKPTCRGINRDLIWGLIKNGSLINHFPESYLLTSKDKLQDRLERDFPDTFIPPVYGSKLIPRCFGEKVWITKPTNGFGGGGIEILDDQTEVQKQIRGGGRLVQKYLENPLLLNGRKFDMRIFVLMTPDETLIFRRCYLRKCLNPYEPGNLRDLSRHLTNTCYQLTFAQTESEKNSLHEFGDGYMTEILDWLREITRWMSTVITQRPECCFELFGLDVILDENSKPWLLEINTNPSLDMSTDVTRELIPELLKAVMSKVFNKNSDVNESWY